MLGSIASGASSNSSRSRDRNFVDRNDEDQHDTITVKSKFTSPKAKALHKVAWTTSSRQKPESRSRPKSPAKRGKRSAKVDRTSRKPASTKASPSRKSDSDSEDHPPSKGRLNHDLTEKRYRSRLNNQFETLLAALPASMIAENEGSIGGADDRREKRISKADVLSLARGHIETLERKGLELEESNEKLKGNLKIVNDMLRAAGWPMLP
jgi:Helix-loop-helix DNA-binding domain